MRRRWEADGHKVVEVCGTGQKIDADLAFLNVDLSFVPPEYVEYAMRFPAQINAGITDIRKSTVSRNRVLPGDGYCGAVIVKTAQNHAGRPERYLLRKPGGSQEQTSGHQIKIDTNSDYKIFSTVSEIPNGVFEDPNLVVERFLPEIHDGRYCIREWMFCGDVSVNCVDLSDSPIISWGTPAPELIQPPPEELRQIRKELRLDYGKLDYVIQDGRPVLYDVNKTTSAGTKDDADDEMLKEVSDYGWLLGAGAYKYFSN